MVVEFALVVVVFLTVVLGAVDVSRWLHGLDAASVASREGAKAAALCSQNASGIASSMRPWLSTLKAGQGQATVQYQPAGCCASQTNGCADACSSVTVTLDQYSVQTVSPWIPSLSLPTVIAHRPRENMNSADNTALCNS